MPESKYVRWSRHIADESVFKCIRAKALLIGATWWCIVKAFCAAVLLIALWCSSDFVTETFERVHVRWPRQNGPEFLSHFGTWDAAHYLYLSEVGYGRDIVSSAFYPLWPLLIRCGAVLTGGNHVLSGLILANLFSAGAFALFFCIIACRFGVREASWGVASLIAFPGSLFFNFVYSESLFLVLVMLFVVGADTRRYWLVWITGFLLPLTRGVGIFCILPLLWHLGQRSIEGRRARDESQETAVGAARELELSERSDWSWSRWDLSWRFLRSAALLCSAPLLGYALYFGLMWHWTGNALEGFEAQRFWNHVHSVSNLWDLKKFLGGFFTPTTWHAFRGSVLDRCVFVLLLYCLPVIWKLDKSWFIWAVVLGVIPAMSGTFTSYIRFASVVFPMFIALGVVFANPRLRWAGYGLLTSFAILHAVLVWRFVNFRWAG